MTDTPPPPPGSGEQTTIATLLGTETGLGKAAFLIAYVSRYGNEEELRFEAAGHPPVVVTQMDDALPFRPSSREKLLAVVQAPVFVSVVHSVERRFRSAETYLTTVAQSAWADTMITDARILITIQRQSSTEETALNAAIDERMPAGVGPAAWFAQTAQACSFQRRHITELKDLTTTDVGAERLFIGDEDTSIGLTPNADRCLSVSTDGGATFESRPQSDLVAQLQKWRRGGSAPFR